MARKKTTSKRRGRAAKRQPAKKKTRRKRPVAVTIRRSSGRKEKFDSDRMAKTTGRSGRMAASRSASSTPLMRGMTMSLRTRSTRSPSCTIPYASEPSVARMTPYPASESTRAARVRTVSSSSTTRIVSVPPGIAATCGATAASRRPAARGKQIVNVVPFPTVLSTQRNPPDCVTMP